MADWNRLGQSSLRSAKLLKEAGEFRSAISRAYYAAYAFSTGRLIDDGHTVGGEGRSNPSHQRLQTMIEANANTAGRSNERRRDLARRFRNLRRFRVMADYDPSSYVDEQLALTCVRDASVFGRELSEGGPA